MGKNDKIDLGQLSNEQGRGCQALWSKRNSRPSNPNTREKHWVGEDVDTEEIDQNSRVPKPRHGQSFTIPFRRLRLD